MYVYKSVAESRAANAVIGAFSLAAQDRAVTEGGKAPVSPCVPLCAILLRKPSVYTLSPVKANVGAFVREVENRDKKRFEAALWR